MSVTGKPELLAPAGNMDCARAAVANGADAVYFGLPQFNARMRADNFTAEQLPELVRFLHDHRVRAICAFNTLVFTDELPEAERQLLLLDDLGVDAVLVQDLGLAVLARQLGVRFEVHASTQMTITSPAGVEFIRRLGITRVVLARETSLREIAKFQNCHSERSEESLSGTTETLPLRGSGLRQDAQDDKTKKVELEVFVHGALCVAYSGQCLTSEALGQRSANRGECASACRLPYELIVDGAVKDLGDRRYLLSPRDLAAVREIPELIRLGVRAFKIEGRLKSSEYVAAACQVYRKAIDAVPVTDADWYKLAMTFSRGFTPGWLRGTNHATLVDGRFGTKRGPMIGHIKEIGRDYVAVAGHASARPQSTDGRAEARPSVRPGDGVVFGETEQGGRVWEVRGDRLYFARGHIDFKRLTPGLPVWKTSDPHLERELRRSFAGEIPKPKSRLDFIVTGAAGQPLVVAAIPQAWDRHLACPVRRASSPSGEGTDGGTDGQDAHPTTVRSAMPLQPAVKRPLTTEALREQLGRLGETDFELGAVENRLVGPVILPVSELNRLRRELVGKLQETGVRRQETGVRSQESGARRTAPLAARREPRPPLAQPELIALCRTMAQLETTVASGVGTVYVDFEDIRRYAEAVRMAKGQGARVWLATPRIEKAGEQGFFKVIEQAQPDGVLIRNLGGLEYFKGMRRVGDFSLNVANPVAAELLIGAGLERVTVSYDLNAAQVLDLLRAAPPAWFEIVVHQHLPMFHMEHCVFAAFLTGANPHPDPLPSRRERELHRSHFLNTGDCRPTLRVGEFSRQIASADSQSRPPTIDEMAASEFLLPRGEEGQEEVRRPMVINATNCGRPCDRHEVRLRDRVGAAHPVKADVGCRNTVYHARAQSGAEFLGEFLAAGARVFRVELLDEDAARTREIISAYRDLLAGQTSGLERLNAVRQLGVTSGTLTVLG